MQRIFLFSVLWLAGLLACAAPETPGRVLHVPKLPTAPVIDGQIGDHEWDGASAVTGMATYLGTVVPSFQQVVLYLGYDAQNLYLRMYSPKPTDMVLVANCKESDNEGSLIFEDHIEIQISNHGRENVMRPGVGFYKICANPLDTLSDLWYFTATAGSEATWTSGARVKSAVHDDRWDMEMALPLKSILPEGSTPDNAHFIFQFVRADTCGGIYYVGWAAGDWQSWDRYPEIILDPHAPALQFDRVGDLAEGNLDAHMHLAATAGQPVTVHAQVLNAAGIALFAEKQTLPPGGDAAFTTKQLPLDDVGNTFLLTGVGADGAVFYRQVNPIKKMTADYRDKYLTPWLATKPRAGDYHFDVAYWPYYQKINIGVDLNFFGVRPEILAAPQFDVTLTSAAGAVLQRQAGTLTERHGGLCMNVPALPAGNYTLSLRLLDAAGVVIDEKKRAKLTRVIYPWEHNTQGLARTVITPYTPIKARKQTLSIWGRELEMAPGGLFGRIDNQGEDILSAPMRLEAIIDGKVMPWQPGAVKLHHLAVDRVEVQGTARVAGVPVVVDGTLEYDGWYQIAVHLAPTTPVKVDSLDLVIPLWEKADTVDCMRGWYMQNNGRYAGAIPTGDGVVWESRNLAPAGDYWGSFVPQLFIGNGDKGLWVLAPNRMDWTLDAARSTVTLERVAGKPQLRIRFLAAPTIIDAPRLLDLVFLPEPVKPLPMRWRMTAWAYPAAQYAHDTNGYRYYGAQVDGYTLPTDDDFRKLAEVIDGRPWFTDKEARERSGPPVRQCLPGKPVVLYGSGWKTGMMDEFHTFGGEWLGNSQWIAKPEGSYDNEWNATKTIHWTSAMQSSVVWVNWTQSLIDQYVWYYEKHLRLSGINGTWWDDGGLGVVTDWDARRGAFVPQWWFLPRRQLTKRLNIIGTELGRQPFWLINQHADFSWDQIGWHIEEIFYGQTKGKGYFGVLSPDQFRAVTRSRGGIIPRLCPRADQDLTPEEQQHFFRTAYGMAALHDIGAYLYGMQDDNAIQEGRIPIEQNRIRLMLDQVGAYEDGECIPYWRSAPLVHVTAQQAQNRGANALLITVYRGRHKALLVIANPTDTPVTFQPGVFTIEKSLLGHAPQQCIDAENWQQLPNPASLTVGAYNFRYVLLE